jgi:hypothetical protein
MTFVQFLNTFISKVTVHTYKLVSLLTAKVSVVCRYLTFPNSLFSFLINNALELTATFLKSLIAKSASFLKNRYIQLRQTSSVKASRTSNHPLSALNHSFVSSSPLPAFLIHLIKIALFEFFLILVSLHDV